MPAKNHGTTNQTLCRVNDCVVRLGVMPGEFHWHKHDNEDEFFLELQSRFLINLGNETVTLNPHQAYTVPRGERHRPRAPERTAVLMVEGKSVQPAGDQWKLALKRHLWKNCIFSGS